LGQCLFPTFLADSMVVEDDEFGTTNGDERRRDAAASIGRDCQLCLCHLVIGSELMDGPWGAAVRGPDTHIHTQWHRGRRDIPESIEGVPET
jgi:hypothetical protein